jgi:recombination protein RecA
MAGGSRVNDTLRTLSAATTRLGGGKLIRASDIVPAPRFPSGSLTLDVVLGGGWPGNQWAEVIGDYSSGKTSTVLKTVAANQRANPQFETFWLAAEQFEPGWAQTLGVDTSRVIVSQERCMDVAFEIAVAAVREQLFDLIVIDSYPALIPAEEAAEKSFSDSHVAAGARAFSKFWRKISESAPSLDGSDRPYFGLILNQWRDKVGGWSPHGTPRTSPGGYQKDYQCYVRLEVARTGWVSEQWPLHDKPVKVAQQITYRTIKNKSDSPQASGSVDFYIRNARNGLRIGDYDTAAEYAEMAILFGVVVKNGGWYTFGTGKWNGKPRLKEALRDDPALRDAIAAEVLKRTADPSLIPGDAYISSQEHIVPPRRPAGSIP